MIYLKKGQILADNPSMVVYDQTGYYNDGDSIICSPATLPDEPACRFEAKYIAYGGIVYSISDPDQLLEEVMKLDPNSLLGKDSKQVAVDRMVENIVPQKSEDLTVADVPVEIEDETATTTPPIVVSELPTITPPDELITSTSTSPFDMSTTTPGIISTSTATSTIPIDMSTTTPPIFGTSTSTPPFDMSTTTPGIISTSTATSTPPIDISTTTPPILDISTSTSPFDMSTTTPPVVPPVLDIPSDTASSTSGELVAFAKNIVKKKIVKGLGL